MKTPKSCTSCRFIESPDNDFLRALHYNVERLQAASGCVGYALSRSPDDELSWVLGGYWEDESEMVESFNGAEMARLVNLLIEAGANLGFGSFTPHAPLPNAD